MKNITKTKIIEKYIREQINNNILHPLDKINTKELSDKFNVCSFTVREALMPLVNEGLIIRKTGLGTLVTKSDKNIKRKILIIVPGDKPEDENDFIEKDMYYTYICKELSKRNYEWKIVHYSNIFTKKNFIKKVKLDNSIYTKDLAGIINHISFIPENTFKSLKIPCINISAFLTKRHYEVISSLGLIYFYGLNILSQYANNIVIFHFNNTENYSYSTKRTNEIHNEIKKFNIAKNIYIDQYNPDSAYDILIETIKKNPKINGIFIAEPKLFSPIKKAITKLKLKIPQDIKIFCVTDKNGMYDFNIKWDRIEQNSKEIQIKATDLLINKIQKKSCDDKIFLYPKIIKGNSLN